MTKSNVLRHTLRPVLLIHSDNRSVCPVNTEFLREASVLGKEQVEVSLVVQQSTCQNAVSQLITQIQLEPCKRRANHLRNTTALPYRRWYPCSKDYSCTAKVLNFKDNWKPLKNRSIATKPCSKDSVELDVKSLWASIWSSSKLGENGRTFEDSPPWSFVILLF